MQRDTGPICWFCNPSGLERGGVSDLVIIHFYNWRQNIRLNMHKYEGDRVFLPISLKNTTHGTIIVNTPNGFTQ